MTSAHNTAQQDPGWREHARRLADTLAERGDLRSPQWRAAVATVPRHLLVPYAYEQKEMGGEWTQFATADALERIYSPETLVTRLQNANGFPQPVSSSTKPDLMVRMLEALDVRDGDRVLEIGTGTGYNAALLSERLGDEHVFTVDVDDDLITVARERLAAIGYHPTVVAADGAEGLPEHAPFNRIMATCSVPRVPWAWAGQLTDDGAILVDLKPANSAGNLVLLRRVRDRLEGRFTARWAAFMTMRSPTVPVPPAARAARADGLRTRSTTAPAVPWQGASTVAWFLAQTQLPPGLVYGFDLDPDTRQPVATTIKARDGSWARVGHADSTVTEAGDTPLWAIIDRFHDQWLGLGEPTWDRLGLTVTPDGRHRVWLDEPDGAYVWDLSS
jgi:protein-L-isoaspartate O-methyltransferase